MFTKAVLFAAALSAAAPYAIPAGAQTAAPGSAPMQSQSTLHADGPIAAYTGPAYNNRWDLYAGLIYMNGQAGQDLPDRFNMGGGEVMGTYWLGKPGVVKNLGIAADFRFGAGTSQTGFIGAGTLGLNRILVMESAFTGGVAYRTPFRNRYVGVNLHAMAGGVYGDFDHALVNNPAVSGPNPTSGIVACPAELNNTNHTLTLGMYCNHTAPYAFWGTSLDFNDSAKLSFRLQPDMTFEHFGTETREFFSISLGAMYRFGAPKAVKAKE